MNLTRQPSFRSRGRTGMPEAISVQLTRSGQVRLHLVSIRRQLFSFHASRIPFHLRGIARAIAPQKKSAAVQRAE